MRTIDETKLEIIYESIGSQKFLGPCDRIRINTPGGEEWWQHIMKHKQPISIDEFIENIDPKAVLDDDETFDEFLDIGNFTEFYKTGDVYFIADGDPNGFEFFWKKI